MSHVAKLTDLLVVVVPMTALKHGNVSLMVVVVVYTPCLFNYIILICFE